MIINSLTNVGYLLGLTSTGGSERCSSGNELRGANRNHCNPAISKFGAISVHCAVFHKTFSEGILRNIVKYGKYCETCAIIETLGKLSQV